MSIIGTILWIIVLLFALHLAVPSADMRREQKGNGTYYVLWIILLSVMLAIHYVALARNGHGHVAVMIDLATLGCFLFERMALWSVRLRWRTAVRMLSLQGGQEMPR